MEKELNPKQERFCEEYLVDLNATQAAIRAGYGKSNAGKQGYKLLQDENVRAYIDKLRADVRAALNLQATDAVRELAKVAFCNIKDLLNEDSSLKSIDELDRHTAAAVAGVRQTERIIDGVRTIVTEIRLNDKVNALHLLMKHMGAYELDNKQVNTLKLPTYFEKPNG